MSRRDLFAHAGALLAPSVPAPRRPRVAAIATTYHLRSHADNIVSRFLEGYWIGDRYHAPPCDVASLYVEQVHANDISRRLSAAHGFPIHATVAGALTLGTGRLAVDGVLLVAEHGRYPVNERLQTLYPRYELMRQVADVFRRSRRSVPVFVDKHLSYDWRKARWMYEESRRLGFPLMAGSSCPVTFRVPDLDFPLDTRFEAALEVGSRARHDGDVFHHLEVLQSFVERRRGGETGVRAVRLLDGAAVWAAARAGRWPRALLAPALARALKDRPDPDRDPDAVSLCEIEYRDGFRAYALLLEGVRSEYLFAARADGRVHATNCYMPRESADNFSPLVDAIARMFSTGAVAYPVERTLLTTGVLARLMESRHRGNARIETPGLAIGYRPPPRSYYARGSVA